MKIYLCRAKPELLLLSKTGISNIITVQELAIMGYSLLIDRHYQLNRQGHELVSYIMYGLTCGMDAKNEHCDLAYMSLPAALIHSIKFVSALYRLQEDGTVIFDRISKRIDNIRNEFPSANFHLCVVFNIRHKEWFVYLKKTDEEGRYCRYFSRSSSGHQKTT